MSPADKPARRLQTTLAQAVSKLPKPHGYFQGHHAPTLVLPDNVLAFGRSYQLTGASCHSRHVLLINVDQPGLVAVDGQVMDMPPASAVMVFPYQHHQYPPPPKTTTATTATQASTAPCRLFFTFDLPDDHRLGALRQQVLILDAYAMQLATRACEVYPTTRPAPWPHQPNELVLLLALLLQTLLAQQAAAQVRDGGDHAPCATSATAATLESRKLVLAVGRYLKEHLNEPVTIPSLAAALAISPSHLRHLFKLELKMSLGQYIRRFKCIQAAALIDTTDRSFSQIASDCGYMTLSAFSRSFTREMAMSPRQYRQRLEPSAANTSR